jgi:hypothetical protein
MTNQDTVKLPRFERYMGRRLTCDAAWEPPAPRRLAPGVTPATAAERAQPFYRGKSHSRFSAQSTEGLEPTPQNADAEQRVLGSIMVDKNALNSVREILKPEDFFQVKHQLIYREMMVMNETLIPIELATVTDKLSPGQLESVGGPAYIASLVDGIPDVSHADHYARAVKQCSQRRALIHAAHVMQQAALDGEEDADTIRDRAREAINAVQSSIGLAGEPAGWQEMFHTFADFENAPPLSFAINGFLQNYGATMIGGLSGHGKTLVLNSITKALLAGKGARMWDLFTIEEDAIRILYLIPECSIQSFKHRLKLFDLYRYLRPDDNRLLVRTLSKGPTPCLSDPRILFAAKGAHVILDTAARFGEGDENNAGDNMRGLANDIFALLHSGAREVLAAHHAPKPFANQNVMRLENVLRGSGDIGAMLTTAWGIKQVDADQNIIHIENIKPRDFAPCRPFQIIGRPSIDETGDFALYKRPGDCGSLQDEQEPDRDKGGAPIQAREARAANIELVRQWVRDEPSINSTGLSRKFAALGIKVSDSAIRKYRKEIGV